MEIQQLLLIFPLLLLTVTSSSAFFNESTFLYTITTPRALTKETFHKFFIQVTGYDKPLVKIVSICDSTSLKIEETFTVTQQADGLGFIEYGIPFPDYKSRKIELQFLIYSSQGADQILLVNKTATFSVLKSRFTFIETDKPLYKPNDVIKFRLLTVSPLTLHPTAKLVPKKYKIIQGEQLTLLPENLTQTNPNEDIVYEWIHIKSPSNMKMAQWKNLTWPLALKGLNWKLSDDPENGTWKIITKLSNAHINDVESKEFKVEKYVLPRFVIDILPPSFMTKDQKFVTFSSCAKYGTGKAMKGNATVNFCLTPDYYYRTTKLPRPCISDTKVFHGLNVCELFNFSTSSLQLANETYYGENIKINLAFIEEGTGKFTDKEAKGGKLQSNPFQVTVDAPDSFKHSLPYHGFIYAKTYDNQPVSNVSLNLIVHVGRFYQFLTYINTTYITDQNGAVGFSFTVGENITKLDLQINSVTSFSKIKLLSKRVDQFQSPSFTFLQPSFAYWRDKNTPQNCSLDYALFQLQSNVDLSSKVIYASVQSRGEIIKVQEFPVDNITKMATCSDSNDDIKGHYRCVSKEEDKWLVNCLPGWSGYNCLTPVCNQFGCANGACIKPNTCTCVRGWSGKNCSVCEKSAGCINGFCTYGDDCYCNKGWEGSNCTIPTNSTGRYYKQDFEGYDFGNKLTYHPDEIQYAGFFERELKLSLNFAMYPNALVVFHFIYNESEFITQSFKLHYANCFMQHSSLKISFGEGESVKPKTNIKMTISSTVKDTKDCKCGLGIRDIAMTSLGSVNELKKDKVSEDLQKLTLLLAQSWSLYNPFDTFSNCYRIYPRSLRPYSSINDATKSFLDTGLFIISNAFNSTRLCYPMARGRSGKVHYKESTAGGSAQEDEEDTEQKLKKALETNLRTFFPEVWKFEYMESIEEPISLKAPDSMTTWIANVFCVFPQSGLQIAEPTSLTVFQPFFMDVVLPYSLIRGEIASVPVKIFNYLQPCYGIVVQVVKSDQYELLSSPFTELCLCDDVTLDLQIKGTVIGKVNITLAAQAFSMDGCQRMSSRDNLTNVEQSNDLDLDYVFDAISREILFEAEGVPQEVTMGDLLCSKNETTSVKFVTELKNSEDLVEDSVRGYVMWSGDVMGSTLTNLEQLIRMPYGCGEQNMVSMVPSIYVLQYFSSLKIKKPATVTLAKNYISIGYERQLKYRMKDGSYSAFGEADKIGSTWLTAFVYKSFVAATQFVHNIDFEVLESARNYILSRQLSNGCFKEDGRVFSSSMKGGLGKSESDDVSLTAYILAAFLENKENRNSNSTIAEAIVKAVECLTINTPAIEDIHEWNQSTTYSIALRAYALNLYDSSHILAKTYTTILNGRKKSDKANIYWKADENANTAGDNNKGFLRYYAYTSADVETTAYGLLTRLLTDGKRNLVVAVPIVKWLTSQRNSIGGWYSTQDTILGLQAISTFSSFISTESTDLQLSVSGEQNGFSSFAKIDEDNKLLFNEVKVKVPDTFEFKSTGQGCAMVQVNVKFNTIKVEKPEEAFRVEIQLHQNKSNCNLANLEICIVTTVKDFKSNMAVVKVKLVSGWEVTENSLDMLKKSFTEGGLKRIEQEKGFITFYFDYFTNLESCVKIETIRKVLIFDPKPGSLQVYDYYSPEKITEVFYPAFHPSCTTSFSSKKLNEERKILAPSCPKCESISTVKNINDLCLIDYEKIFLAMETINSNNESVWMLSKYNNDSTLAKPKEIKFLFPYECKCSIKSGRLLIVKRSPSMSKFKQVLYINKEYDVYSFEENDLVNKSSQNFTCQEDVEEVIRFYLKDPKYWAGGENISSKTSGISSPIKESLLVVESKEMMCAQCFNFLDANSSAELKSFKHKDVTTVTAIATSSKAPDEEITWSLHNEDQQKISDKYIDTKKCFGCELRNLSRNFTQPIYLYTMKKWKLKLENGEQEPVQDRRIIEESLTIRPDGDFLILSQEAKTAF